MKYCANCGKPMEDNQHFCTACGHGTGGSAPRNNGAAPNNNIPKEGVPYQYLFPPRDQRESNAMGVASLVCSIVGIIFLILFVGIFLEILAIVFGAVGIAQCRKRPNEYRGSGLAIAGMVVGIVITGIAIIGILAGAITFHFVF